MKIESIKLHNFMRYKGDNELKFSTDDEKNVTVVLGNNTFGKTTLAQAFRWVLYEELNDTSYTKKKDVVLLNNEVIAEMTEKSVKDVYVELTVINGKDKIKFVRRQTYNKKTPNPNDYSIKQIGATQLTMQKIVNDIPGDIIPNSGGKIGGIVYKEGVVREAIENLFPSKLSNYLFFDGERWNDLKSKTSDIKESIETILGVSSLLEMKKHLKDNYKNVISVLKRNIDGSSSEIIRLKEELKEYERQIGEYDEKIKAAYNAYVTVQKTFNDTEKVLNDNKDIEQHMKDLKGLEKDISQYESFKNSNYADIVKIISNDAAKWFAREFLGEYEKSLRNVDLQGKDIPGITVDTVDYLLEHDECLCGRKLSEDKEAYDTIVKLRKLVPPEMLGGAANKLLATLEAWSDDVNELVDNIKEKAESYETCQDTIDDKVNQMSSIERLIDRKIDLEPVRKSNKLASIQMRQYEHDKIVFEQRKNAQIEAKEKKEKELMEKASLDAANRQIQRAIAYAKALYEMADKVVKNKTSATLNDLNEIIKENFQIMFNDREKYATLGSDYKIHVYYHSFGDKLNYEETNLSNGETVAINFVYVVSILELAKKQKELEMQDEKLGMKEAVLELPLVLDGPFSSLSNENTNLIANRLPKFAEQVIIFMLDKDWEASELSDYTLPQYCYRVKKESSSNSSTLDVETMEV